MADEHVSEWMAGYQRGDLDAFEGLYRALAPRLLRYLSALTRNREHAEDLLQETFLQVHRARRTYLPERPVVPWAFAIARYVYLMDVRTRAKAGRREVASPGEAVPDIPVPPEAEGLADRDRLQRALGRLPPDQLEAVLLHYVWGFTFREIAGTVGVAPVTAKVRAFRGMRQLRRILTADV